MRRLLIVLALLAPAPTWAQVALVQSATNTDGGMWVTGSFDQQLDLPGAATSGNLIAAWTEWGNSARTMSCTFDGNAMTRIAQKGATAANGDAAVEIFAFVATSTGTAIICTISGNDANGIQAFVVAEFSGMAATLSTSGGAGVSAATAVETSAATSHDSGADLTPDTTHNLFLYGMLSIADGGTWGDDGATMLVSGTNRRIGYLIQAAATAGDWVPTTSNSVTGEVTAVNLDGAAASSAAPCGLMLLGAGKCGE